MYVSICIYIDMYIYIHHTPLFFQPDMFIFHYFLDLIDMQMMGCACVSKEACVHDVLCNVP